MSDHEDMEKRELGTLMENKIFRTFIRYHILEPCGVFTRQNVGSEAHNAKMIALHDLAQDMVENMKFANIEGYFELLREHNLDEEEEETNEGKE